MGPYRGPYWACRRGTGPGLAPAKIDTFEATCNDIDQALTHIQQKTNDNCLSATLELVAQIDEQISHMRALLCDHELLVSFASPLIVRDKVLLRTKMVAVQGRLRTYSLMPDSLNPILLESYRNALRGRL